MYHLVLLSVLLACAAGVPINNTKLRLDVRIVGGNETDITSHPYQAYYFELFHSRQLNYMNFLQKEKPTLFKDVPLLGRLNTWINYDSVSVMRLGSFWCSGTIISANWVVTTAFCVDLEVRIIQVKSGSTYSNSGGTLHDATSVIVHENVNFHTWDYDIALVQVRPAFTFSASVQPITLECNPVPVGTDAVLTGWGLNSVDDKPLQEVNVKIISDSECNSTYVIYDGITDRMICAMDPNGGKGACQDFGGPLVASNKLVGLYTMGWGCGSPLYPEVYTKISAFCDWIVINAGL